MGASLKYPGYVSEGLYYRWRMRQTYRRSHNANGMIDSPGNAGEQPAAGGS